MTRLLFMQRPMLLRAGFCALLLSVFPTARRPVTVGRSFWVHCWGHVVRILSRPNYLPIPRLWLSKQY